MAPEEPGPDYEELQRFARLSQENDRRLKDGRRPLCTRCFQEGREPEELVPKPHPRATPGVVEYMECPRDGFAILVPLALRKEAPPKPQPRSELDPELLKRYMEADERPRQSPYFLFHHNKRITEPLVGSLIRELAPPPYVSLSPRIVAERGSPKWEEQVQRYLEGAKSDEFTGVSWFYPLERERAVLDSQIFVALKIVPFETRPHQIVKLHQLMSDDRWVMVKGQESHLAWWKAADMQWFLDKCQPFARFFEADFACADLEKRVVKNLKDGADPASLAWPLMVFGDEQVKRFGREHLLDSPAWKVEELPYGGIWVQVWENPFDAPQKMVTTLAKHLGLEARRS